MSKTPETGRFIPTLTEVIDSPGQLDLSLTSVQSPQVLNSATASEPLVSKGTVEGNSSEVKINRFSGFMDLQETAKRSTASSSSTSGVLFPPRGSGLYPTGVDKSTRERIEPSLNQQEGTNLFMDTQVEDDKSATSKAQPASSPVASSLNTSNVRMTVHVPNQPLVRPVIRAAVSAQVQPTFQPIIKPSVQSATVTVPTFRPVVKPEKSAAEVPYNMESGLSVSQKVESIPSPIQASLTNVSGEEHTPTKNLSTSSHFESSTQEVSQPADLIKEQDKLLGENMDEPNEPDIFASFTHNPAASPESLRPSDLMLIALSERIAAKARIRIEQSIEEHIHAQIFPMLDTFAAELVSHIQGDLLKIMREGIAQATREELDRLRPRKK